MISSTALAASTHDQPGRLGAGAASRGVEAQRRSNAVGDRAGDAREGIGVPLRERAALPAPRDVDRAPHPPADDERRAELVRDARRLEQVPVARAALGVPARGLVEGPDRHPSRGELGERVAVRHEVLAANEQLAGSGRRLGGEDPALDEFCGRVARQEPGVRIERVPAARVVVDHAAQPRRQLREVLVARQAASAEQLDLLAKPVDGPARRRHARIIHRRRRRAGVRERSPLAGDGIVRAACARLLPQSTLHTEGGRRADEQRHDQRAAESSSAPARATPIGSSAPSPRSRHRPRPPAEASR